MKLKPIDNLCKACRDYLDHLPSHERDTRTAAMIGWCLAYECDDYDTLPLYWHKVVGSLLLSLRLIRVDAGCKPRDPAVTEFCVTYLESLWEKHTRHYIALHSRGCWANSKVDGQLFYDTMWTIWKVVND